MAAVSVEFDTSRARRAFDRINGAITVQIDKAEDEVADTILLLSQAEVPHKLGTLQNSGATDRDSKGAFVGYHTPYAARMHEHPEFNFGKGRKGKYLEDPIKHNMQLWRKKLGKGVTDAIEEGQGI